MQLEYFFVELIERGNVAQKDDESKRKMRTNEDEGNKQGMRTNEDRGQHNAEKEADEQTVRYDIHLRSVSKLII